jgi:hypothetical protein
MGYIALPCNKLNIPDTMIIDGVRLCKKDTFHVSLICVKNLLFQLPNSEQKILSLFCDYVTRQPIVFEKFTGVVHYVEDGVRKSIVAFCNVGNLVGLADYLSIELGISIPNQPAHVTLYTLQPNVGIGLNSQNDVITKSKLIQTPVELRPLFQL